MREREGLIARIRQIRRSAPAPGRRAPAGPATMDETPSANLEARIAHLERLVEGLQDSVHRETERQGRMIAELQAQIQPAAIAEALSRDARDRGL